eukprot:5598938-Pleurochrysis_carterae.AAC.1
MNHNEALNRILPAAASGVLAHSLEFRVHPSKMGFYATVKLGERRQHLSLLFADSEPFNQIDPILPVVRQLKIILPNVPGPRAPAQADRPCARAGARALSSCSRRSLVHELWMEQ